MTDDLRKTSIIYKDAGLSREVAFVDRYVRLCPDCGKPLNHYDFKYHDYCLFGRV